MLNLGGSATLNYNNSTTYSKQKGSPATETSNANYGQLYNINLFGDLLRLGSYRADWGWSEQLTKSNGRPCPFLKTMFGCIENASQESRFNVRDDRQTLNLFPQWSPLSLTRQHIVRKTSISDTRDTTDSLGGSWMVNIRKLPRLMLNYQQTKLKQEPSGMELISRAGSVMTDLTFNATRIGMGYQFSQTDGNRTEETHSHGANLDLNSQLTTNLTLSAFIRYMNTRIPAAAVPGLGVVQERSYGTGLYYRPALHWWDGSLFYNYNENPYFSDFKSQSVVGTSNFRWNEKTDSSAGARYLQFSTSGSTVNSESGDFSLNYRPIFGLTTGVNAGVGATSVETAGATDTDSLYQNYSYRINYGKPWRLIQYRAAYQISYGASDTSPTGYHSRDIGNTINLGLDNTNTRILHVSLNTTYSDIQRATNTTRSEQTSYLAMFSADSSYFKSLIMRGDSLLLRGAATYSDTTGFGVEGRVMSGELNGAYQTPIGLSANGSYRIEDYPTELFLDRQVFTGQVLYSTLLAMNLTSTLSARDIFEDNRYRDDINRVELSVNFAYHIGKLNMGLQYQEIGTYTNASRTITRTLMAQATRTF